jgi:hypothetical protein
MRLFPLLISVFTQNSDSKKKPGKLSSTRPKTVAKKTTSKLLFFQNTSAKKAVSTAVNNVVPSDKYNSTSKETNGKLGTPVIVLIVGVSMLVLVAGFILGLRLRKKRNLKYETSEKSIPRDPIYNLPSQSTNPIYQYASYESTNKIVTSPNPNYRQKILDNQIPIVHPKASYYAHKNDNEFLQEEHYDSFPRRTSILSVDDNETIAPRVRVPKFSYYEYLYEESNYESESQKEYEKEFSKIEHNSYYSDHHA